MNTLVVYFSKFGHTQKIAEVITETLRSTDAVRMIRSDQLNADELNDVNLVVMGSPTHRMNLPEAVRPVFEALPKRSLRGTYIAAYDTSYKMSAFLSLFTAAKKLTRKLRKLGGVLLLPLLDGRKGGRSRGGGDLLGLLDEFRREGGALTPSSRGRRRASRRRPLHGGVELGQQHCLVVDLLRHDVGGTLADRRGTWRPFADRAAGGAA